MLTYDLKLMCVDFDQFIVNSYEDMNDNVKSQNGAWMTSWLSDHAEKLIFTIPEVAKNTVKISRS